MNTTGGEVNNAVNMAAQERIRWEATILHADHGPQFTSWGFGENLRRWGLLESFGTIGDCFDNAVMEAFWRYCQFLWMSDFQATSVPVLAGSVAPAPKAAISVGRSSSLPLWNTAPARTSATKCGALTARHRDCAASMSL